MDLNAIRTFCRTVEAGNLTAAARLLHITKSVASRRIQTLEDDLGVKLLNRSTRGVAPTDVGIAFYERALAILADLEEAEQSVKCAGGRLVGQLRFTAPRSFTDLHLAKPISIFLQQHPDLRCEMNLTDERVDIIGGGYDLGLRIVPNLKDSSLIARKLVPMRNHVAASPAYLAEHGVPQTPDDLKGHTALLYSNLATNTQWWLLKDGKPHVARVQGRMVSNSGTMQLVAAKEGLGLVMMPRFYLHDALEKGELVEVLKEWSVPQTFLYALYPDRRLLPLKVRVFIDFLADWFAKEENSFCL